MFLHVSSKFQIFSKIFSKTFQKIFQYIPKIELVTWLGQVNGWFQNQQKPKLLEAARSDIGIRAGRDVRPNKYILQKIDKKVFTLDRGQGPLLPFQSHPWSGQESPRIESHCNGEVKRWRAWKVTCIGTQTYNLSRAPYLGGKAWEKVPMKLNLKFSLSHP